ncbi:MAG: energy-coupling factor transporter transmembrane protein EcfT [Desulfobacter sp.]|nr:MAG: energy-coupling factor transporter transmembrane protein EcfT [Desulfobacter sp.]
MKRSALNPLTILAGVAALVVLAFMAPDFRCSLGLFSMAVLPAAAAGRCMVDMAVMLAKFLGPFCLFLFPIHALVIPGDAPPLLIWGVSVNIGGIHHAALITTRLMVMTGSVFLLFRAVHPGTLLRVLTDRGLPWGPAYVICATLQLLPRMKQRAATIIQAQQSRGLNISGGPLSRARALIPLAGPLLFGMLAEVEQRALALELKQRACSSRRTSYRIIPDSKGQARFRWFCLAAVLGAGGLRLWLYLY